MNREQEQSLDPNDREQLQRLLASPVDFPEHFRAWLVDFIGNELTASAVVGLMGRLAKLDGLYATATWDPVNIADGAATSTTVTVTGASVGDFAFAGFTVAVPAGAALTAAVTAADTVTVTLVNHTGGALNLGSGTLKVRVLQED